MNFLSPSNILRKPGLLSHVQAHVVVGVELLEDREDLSVGQVEAQRLQSEDQLIELDELVLVPVERVDESLRELVDVFELQGN